MHETPDNKDTFVGKWDALLSAIEQRLFAGQRKSTRKSKLEAKKAVQIVSKSKRQLQLWFVGGASLLFLVGFVYAVYFYANTVRIIESDPLVTNLRTLGVKARVNFGASPLCGSAKLPVECWVDPYFNDQAWPEGLIPDLDPRKMPGYRQGANTATQVYYRIDVPISAALLASDKEIIYSPLYIDHEKFAVFINGRLAQDSRRTSANGKSILFVPILRSDVRDGQVKIVIKSSMHNADSGIRHFGGAYVGPRDAMEKIFLISERSLQSYFMLFLLSKGSIFIVFALFFYFSIERRALFHFLLYAFCVTAENLIAGNFLVEYLSVPVRVVSFYTLKTVAIANLLLFFVEYFQASRGRRYAWYLIGCFAGALLAISGTFLVKSSLITLVHWRGLINVPQFIVLGLGLVLSMLALRQWKRHGVSGEGRNNGFKMFFVVIAIYLTLLIWELTFNPFVGFDKRAVFDLIFFYFIAFITAREFGFNAGQVITLEAHMVEKNRMEAELNEAAEIAKAFLPGSAPRWEFCQIGVYHKPLSESSGDWFTFQESRSKQFCHLIMCDITGHGVQAALVVSTCRTVLSAMIADNPDCLESSRFIVDYANSLNRILFAHGEGRHVSTLLGLTFDQEQHKVHHISAGHPYPLLISTDPESGRRSIKALTTRHTVLGISGGTEYKMQSHDIKPGDEVVAFTDGIPIATHIKKFKSYVDQPYSLADAPLALYKDIWQAEAEKNEKEPDDDVSIVWFKRVS